MYTGRTETRYRFVTRTNNQAHVEYFERRPALSLPRKLFPQETVGRTICLSIIIFRWLRSDLIFLSRPPFVRSREPRDRVLDPSSTSLFCRTPQVPRARAQVFITAITRRRCVCVTQKPTNPLHARPTFSPGQVVQDCTDVRVCVCLCLFVCVRVWCETIRIKIWSALIM